MSKVFLFFCEVFKQISSCFSILSSAKFRWQFLQAMRSSRGLGAKTDLRAGVDPPAGPFFFMAGEGGTVFLASLISILTVLLFELEMYVFVVLLFR